jgi:phospholipid/cholesterol/gamma-HCH transport system substrate-binding protein
MASARSIEVKVGMLILVALGLLAGLILVMGGINFEPTFRVVVGFDNPGGLQSDAPVKIAGVKVGKVEEITFNTDPPDQRVVDTLVYVHVSIEEQYRETLRDNAVFYITTQGVLGEQFLAIDPGSNDRPVITAGAVVRGLDPPRLDRLIAESYDLLHTTVSALRENRPQLARLFEGLTKTLEGTGTFFEQNQDRLDRVAANVEKMSEEGVATIEGARDQYVNNPRIDRIFKNLEILSAASARDVPILLTDAKKTVTGVNKVVGVVGDDAQLAKIRGVLDDLAASSKDVRLAAGDARAIAAHVRRGRGSVGALVMDEQLFDDLQELARDLKHNPWKFFWKE